MAFDYENFSGYILAGGKSSRMGRDKAFLEINGKTFLENAVDILSPVCDDRVKVVLNKEQNHFVTKLPEELPYIFDIYEDRGPVGGIHAALKDCDTQFAFILAVDIPLISIKLIKQMVNTMKKLHSDVVIPKNLNGRIHQLCAVYKRKTAYAQIEQLLAQPQKSISVLDFVSELESIEWLVLPENEDLDNINRPSDYASLELNSFPQE